MRHLSDVDLRLIRIFCTIVDCKGFHDAQIALNMAQSTLSTHLANLEAKLGSKLCQRGRGGFRLTAAGEDTYAAAQGLLNDLERFEATMDRVHGRQVARLRIGLIDSLTTFDALDLPGCVARFAAAHPEARLEVDTDTPAGLQKSLLSATRDVVIGASLQPLPGLDYAELATELHHLYCGQAHPWFTRPDADLSQEDFLKAAFSVRNYMHFDDTYRLGRVTARATVGSMEAQEILVLSGAYLGFLPAHRGALWQAQGRMRAVKPNDWSFNSRFFAAFDPRREGAALRQAFVAELRAVETDPPGAMPAP
ncbi:HTH-type transcriptional regulator BenM [Roseovarius sp. A-2]|uniref:LysR family transcriptional regulator n=1 Tax=Roseovarius sp. A-2 TaxID=1570360 RepID=UPI0009B57C97|nr:LysR family transcriptional regulator [Roseovarius sp. A-2]GAW35249.1 HTH-type transcriptional regulator BenM [Roseovarius sp. A-2]